MTTLDLPSAVPRPTSVARTRDRAVVAVFITASLLGSALLFLVQPLVGRLLLPRAGGSASLWNTAMVFFQCTLLAGYVLAHVGIRTLGVARHRVAQLILLTLPLLVLRWPCQTGGHWTPSEPSSAHWVC